MAVAQTFIGKPWRQPYSAQQLQDSVAHAVPIIGTNGNFWRWSIDTSDWEDTGIAAGAGLVDGSVTWPKLAADARPIRRNLFDNGHMGNVINQRGKTVYSESGYAMDRWVIQNYSESASVEIKDGYVTLTAKNNDGPLQRIEPGTLITGETYTLSVLTNGGQLLTRTFVHTNDMQVLEYPGTIWSMAVGNGTKLINVWPIITYNQSTSQSIDIVDMYLEQSDHQTAFRQETDGNWAVNEIPNYWIEWLKCRQYFRVIKGPTLLTGVRDYSTTQTVGVPITDGPMRAKPTPVLQKKSNIAAVGANGSALNVTSALPGSKYHFMLSGTEGQITINGPVAIYCNDDIWLDADL